MDHELQGSFNFQLSTKYLIRSIQREKKDRNKSGRYGILILSDKDKGLWWVGGSLTLWFVEA